MKKKEMSNKIFLAVVLAIVLVTALVVVVSNFIPNSNGVTGWASKSGSSEGSIVCTDGDFAEGYMYSIYTSSVTYLSNGASGKDSCSGSTLTEYYCRRNNLANKQVNCVEGCSNGACNPIPDSCEDSDNGVDHSVKGNIKGFFSNKEYFYFDSCIGVDSLNEFYCDGDIRKSKKVECPRKKIDSRTYTGGCLDGRCLVI